MTRSEFEKMLLSTADASAEVLTEDVLQESFAIDGGAYHFVWTNNNCRKEMCIPAPRVGENEEIGKEYFESFVEAIDKFNAQTESKEFQADLWDKDDSNNAIEKAFNAFMAIRLRLGQLKFVVKKCCR